MTKEIEQILKNSKTIAMVGVSSLKKKRGSKKLKKKTINDCNEVYAGVWL
jgi:predicted CoA-binding protein